MLVASVASIGLVRNVFMCVSRCIGVCRKHRFSKHYDMLLLKHIRALLASCVLQYVAVVACGCGCGCGCGWVTYTPTVVLCASLLYIIRYSNIIQSNKRTCYGMKL
jgi:hypothetical protein